MIGHTMATFSVIVSGDRDSKSTHAACGLVEAATHGSAFAVSKSALSIHSYVDMGGVGPPSEKNRFSASTASADEPNTHCVHSVRGKPTPPSRATAKAEKHRQNPWVALDRRAQPRVRLTPTLVSNEHKPRCLWMVNWLPCAQQRARASDECLLDQRNTELGRKKS